MRLSNRVTSLWPVIPTAAIMARAINPAMRLYSMAVAPDSSRRNFPSMHFPRTLQGCLWHVQVAAKTTRSVKLQSIEATATIDDVVYPIPAEARFETMYLARALARQRDPAHISDRLLRP